MATPYGWLAWMNWQWWPNWQRYGLDAGGTFTVGWKRACATLPAWKPGRLNPRRLLEYDPCITAARSALPMVIRSLRR